ncbi:hypothetical protein AEAC466_04535 [Asticcacaulis sp. AC466]|nr:hypothetical protein AEAC466_04535 [Asticcacaulis sp. AC466]
MGKIERLEFEMFDLSPAFTNDGYSVTFRLHSGNLVSCCIHAFGPYTGAGQARPTFQAISPPMMDAQAAFNMACQKLKPKDLDCLWD